ncbi:hypothetical protein PTT_06609 [Pyrenophora teres f. teres 0-1]|uniref:Uncharacterized protein n=1 Tax=Pyrenophora teres f. teres (strain 0-1) TaxID=861557 RepID=E3RFT9_PYRTT|nr:hypothetical protein PTT_06609 [Pyrenophora teres f. teres 0-1]
MAKGNVGLQRLLVKPENYAEVYKQLVLRLYRATKTRSVLVTGAIGEKGILL